MAKKLWMVIEDALTKASEKGYTVTRVFGIVSKYKELAKLPKEAKINDIIASLNDYLDKHNIVCFSSRKGIYFAYKDKYKPAQNVDIEL